MSSGLVFMSWFRRISGGSSDSLEIAKSFTSANSWAFSAVSRAIWQAQGGGQGIIGQSQTGPKQTLAVGGIAVNGGHRNNGGNCAAQSCGGSAGAQRKGRGGVLLC